MLQKSSILFTTIILMFLAAGNAYCDDNVINPNDLIGIWKQDLPGEMFFVLRIDNDNTFHIAWDVDRLDNRPVDKGQLKLEGNQLTFVSSESTTCKNNIGK